MNNWSLRYCWYVWVAWRSNLQSSLASDFDSFCWSFAISLGVRGRNNRMLFRPALRENATYKALRDVAEAPKWGGSPMSAREFGIFWPWDFSIVNAYAGNIGSWVRWTRHFPAANLRRDVQGLTGTTPGSRPGSCISSRSLIWTSTYAGG